MIEGSIMDVVRPTVEGLLKTIKSGIGIDAAKLHTGICIWDGQKVETYGFRLNEYDKDDPFAEYKMRRDFKNKLLEYVDGKTFQVCIIEDCYGGENFDTVRKLLAIQTVIDELIFEKRVFVDEFYRKKEPVWFSNFRKIYKVAKGYDSKIETQMILEYLNFDFYMQYKDYPDRADDAKKRDLPTKSSFFFEDRCDATAQLLSIAMEKITNQGRVSEKPISFADIKVYYLNAPVLTFSNDKVLKVTDKPRTVKLNTRNLQQSIIDCVKSFPDDVMIAEVPVDKLGVFGVKQKFTFYSDGEGWIVFYKKR